MQESRIFRRFKMNSRWCWTVSGNRSNRDTSGSGAGQYQEAGVTEILPAVVLDSIRKQE
jgi:hypothetical protein